MYVLTDRCGLVNCLYHVSNRGSGWHRKTCLSSPVFHYWPFQGVGSDVVLCRLFLVPEFRWCFTLCLFIIILVRFGLLSDHLLGNSCPLVLIVFGIFLLFPILVLRARFAFWLPQFLFIAFSLLSWFRALNLLRVPWCHHVVDTDVRQSANDCLETPLPKLTASHFPILYEHCKNILVVE